MDCLFCKIVKGEIPSAKIYEDEHIFSFLDIHPVTKGHALVVPKKHAEGIFDIDQESLGKVMATGKKLAQGIKNTLKADGINLLQSNGKPAGQVIFHFHLHLIPRYENDGLKTHGFFGEREGSVTFEELKELAQKIKVEPGPLTT